jgi:hypothetical protein
MISSRIFQASFECKLVRKEQTVAVGLKEERLSAVCFPK